MRAERPLPAVWSAEELETSSRHAIERFIDEAAQSADYAAEFGALLPVVTSLFTATGDLTVFDARLFADRPELVEPARYLAGPPLSADDLDTFVGGQSKRKGIPIPVSERVVGVVRRLLDPCRYPWLQPERPPTDLERDVAIRWTTGLLAAERTRTARRNQSSRRQEQAVATALAACGLRRLAPNPREVVALDELERGCFCRETQIAGTKCDVPVRLGDGRLLALECKVSNSATNSVKRLLRETGGKAEKWRTEFGNQVITAAVLAGVFRVGSLVDAQREFGLAIFWEHDLAPLTTFIGATM